MTEVFFGLVSSYGLWVIAASAFLSCLALPIPTFAVMLAGGAFVASGDLILWQVLGVAYAAALAGDQTGFQIGRWGGPALIGAIGRQAHRAELLDRAQASLQRWGGLGVFFSTWLVAPLGPWVNLMAGAVQISWLRFMLWDAAGEAIWVTAYVLLGYAFGANLETLAGLVGNWSGLISAVIVTAFLGAALIVRLRSHSANG